MAGQPIFYSRPEVVPARLRLQPRLASWNAAAHPDQIRLREAMDDATAVLAPSLEQLAGPLALRLDVGLPPSVPLLAEHDLDNYAYPLGVHIGPRIPQPLVSMWCTKRHADDSYIMAEQARPARPHEPNANIEVRTTASASTTAYKQQISEQVRGASTMPDGPVALEIAFVVGPRRNWLNLWKPTIDALDPLLGRTRQDRDWHPRDGRISELGLHCTIDPTVGSEVTMQIAARATSL